MFKLFYTEPMFKLFYPEPMFKLFYTEPMFKLFSLNQCLNYFSLNQCLNYSTLNQSLNYSTLNQSLNYSTLPTNKKICQRNAICKAWLLILNSSPLSPVHPGTLYRIDNWAYSSIYPTKAWGPALLDSYPTDVSILCLSEDTSLLTHHSRWISSASLRISEDALYSPAGSRMEPQETQSS